MSFLFCMYVLTCMVHPVYLPRPDIYEPIVFCPDLYSVYPVILSWSAAPFLPSFFMV